MSLDHQFQGRSAVERGKRVICQDDVPIVVTHGFHERLAILDARKVAGDTLPAKRFANQLCITVAVFKMQDLHERENLGGDSFRDSQYKPTCRTAAANSLKST